MMTNLICNKEQSFEKGDLVHIPCDTLYAYEVGLTLQFSNTCKSKPVIGMILDKPVAHDQYTGENNVVTEPLIFKSFPWSRGSSGKVYLVRLMTGNDIGQRCWIDYKELFPLGEKNE